MLSRPPAPARMSVATPARSPSWLPLALMLLGVAGCIALWVLVALATARVSSWMAVVAALDAALLLRMARVRPGVMRAFWGVLATAAVILVSVWTVLGGLLGRMLGLGPGEAASRLGAHHAWTLFQTTHSAADVAWLAAGLVIAAVLSR